MHDSQKSRLLESLTTTKVLASEVFSPVDLESLLDTIAKSQHVVLWLSKHAAEPQAQMTKELASIILRILAYAHHNNLSLPQEVSSQLFYNSIKTKLIKPYGKNLNRKKERISGDVRG